MPFRLKPVLPRSLFARTLALIVVPLLVLQLVVGTMFVQRHFERVARQLSAAVADDLAIAMSEANSFEAPDYESRLRRSLMRFGIHSPDPEDPRVMQFAGEHQIVFWDLSANAIADYLETRFGGDVKIATLYGERGAILSIKTDGKWLHFEVARRDLAPSNAHQMLVAMTFSALVMIGIAVVFLRNQVRAMARLTEAAEAFGRGEILKYRPRGADEIRRAGHAFLAMRGRILRQREHRMLLLSGVSHDLKSPLTRMNLTLSFMEPDEDVDALTRDVREMGNIVETFLDYAAIDSQDGVEEVDLALLARERLALFDLEERLSVDENTGKITIPGRAPLIARALDNIIENANRFANRIEVHLGADTSYAYLRIDDDGPGIKESERDAAIKPFMQLDTARDPNAGGHTGLGLAIAVDVARVHGGKLSLGRSELGGLSVVIALPKR